MSNSSKWPALPPETWRETLPTLHMWTQIVGKIVLKLTPLTNHFWNVAMRVTPQGLTTPAIPYRGRTFTMSFDFLEQRLVIACSDGAARSIALEPRTVAEFYRLIMQALHELGIEVRIWTLPSEVPNPIRFEDDHTHVSYDPAAAAAFWRILNCITPLFEQFRARFIGKCSPVHFFWGSFDLAVTRFSGQRAPARPGADVITREAYSHAVISHGFWPGGGSVAEPAFYAYAVPQPAGFKEAAVRPAAAQYNTGFSEFILPYSAVAAALSPEADLSAFLNDTYDAAAALAGWDRSELERAPLPGIGG
jgi:hypothetical protein